jgi:hypothetical protein
MTAVILLVAAIGSAIIGLAGPYREVVKYAYKDIRFFFLLDVSKSMQMCEDIRPNRLVAAKQEIEKSYIELPGVAATSLIPFSGAANIGYCPLTTKKSTFLTLLREVDYKVVDIPGTSVESAFSALHQIANNRKITSGKNIVVVLSDGGLEEGLTIDRDEIKRHISELKKFGFVFSSIGLGSDNCKLTKRIDNVFEGYYVDGKGNMLRSSLDESVLKFIAAIGNGSYVRYSSSGDMSRQITNIANQFLELDLTKPYNEVVSLDHWFYGASCLLLVGYVLMQVKK